MSVIMITASSWHYQPGWHDKISIFDLTFCHDITLMCSYRDEARSILNYRDIWYSALIEKILLNAKIIEGELAFEKVLSLAWFFWAYFV